MKKFFAIAIIAGSIVACNNSGKKTETTDTTTKMENTTPVPDTNHMGTDTTMTTDTTSHM